MVAVREGLPNAEVTQVIVDGPYLYAVTHGQGCGGGDIPNNISTVRRIADIQCGRRVGIPF